MQGPNPLTLKSFHLPGIVTRNRCGTKDKSTESASEEDRRQKGCPQKGRSKEKDSARQSRQKALD
jgi:hypothetical protein